LIEDQSKGEKGRIYGDLFGKKQRGKEEDISINAG